MRRSLALVAAAALGGAVRANDFLNGERLLADLCDEAALAFADLLRLDRRWASAASGSNVVVSLSSIPSRLPYIAATLKSLLRQTRRPAEIRLNLPRHSLREGRAYVVPSWLADLRAVRIVECDDWGPATKLIPSLLALAPDQKILVVDDDRVYSPTLVADLDGWADDHPDSAVGLSGWVVPSDLVDRPTTLWSNLLMLPPAPIRAVRLRHGREVDVLQGLSGYLIRPRFFDLARVVDYQGAPEAAFYVDDVWLSAHCRVPKYVVPARRTNYPPKWRRRLFTSTGLGLLNRGGGDPQRRNNTLLLKHLGPIWRVGGPQRPRPF